MITGTGQLANSDANHFPAKTASGLGAMRRPELLAWAEANKVAVDGTQPLNEILKACQAAEQAGAVKPAKAEKPKGKQKDAD